jgi:succinate dehydrogenase / fumarate reductase cytochrome b subunit
MPATNPRPQADADVVNAQADYQLRDAAQARRSFVVRRLHSLSGVVPVGVFLIVHLWTNAAALGGQAPFDNAVSKIHHLPFLPLIEVVGIFLPLAFHAGYGVKLAFSSRPNPITYPYARNWAYTLQRVTGVIALVFIVYHVQELRLAKLLGHLPSEAFYPTLARNLSSTSAGVPWLAIGYLVGIAASVLHFANGLTSFVLSWGISGSRASQARFATAFSVLGVLLFALGAATTLYFATGVGPFAWLGMHSSDGSEQSAVVDPPGNRAASAFPRDGASSALPRDTPPTVP